MPFGLNVEQYFFVFFRRFLYHIWWEVIYFTIYYTKKCNCQIFPCKTILQQKSTVKMPTIVKVSMIIWIISVFTVWLTEIFANLIDSNFFGIHEVRDVGLRVETWGLSKASNVRYYKISELSFKDVVRLMLDHKTNLTKLDVWSKLEDNDTRNDDQTLLINF